ncbi:MAG: class 1 fructose-bisphosphatase [Nocardioides sp.]
MPDHATQTSVPLRPTLADALAAWAGADPNRGDVSEVIARLAAVGAELTQVLAANALAVAEAAPAAPAAANASGDDQKPLDVQAEEMFLTGLTGSPVAAVCSEETEEAIPVTDGGSLVVVIDPVDGSGNIDINAPVGTIFGILPVAGHEDDPAGAALQTGRHLLAAGYIVYGPSAVLALSYGEGTDLYALDPAAGTFIRTASGIQIPEESREYAINASNALHWPHGINRYITDLVSGSAGPRGQSFNMRWLAALVAEAYRIFVRGGIYLYPADDRSGYEHGRLRLVYEGNPIAYLCQQAGGLATDGVTEVLDLEPTDLHQRIPLVFGSRAKVERVRRYLTDPQTYPEQSPLFAERGLFRE